MKVLVTGGTGFTGSALVLRLLELGHTVTSLDHKPGARSSVLEKAGARLVTGTIADKTLVSDCVRGQEVVFHLAAAFRELNVTNDHYRLINVDGTCNVMEAAEKGGVRKVIYCSTQGVHGHISRVPGDEDSPIAPADYYQQTKYEGELVVREFMARGFCASIIRPTAIYGPGDPERFYMIFKRVKKGCFPMFGSGRTFYHPVYIDNLVDAFLLVLQPGAGDGEAYIIADEKYYSIRELVQRVATAMGVRVRIIHLPLLPLIAAGHLLEKSCKPFGITPPLFPRRVDWFRQVRAFRIDKARTALGYSPRIDIDEGLKRTAAWYRAEGLL